MQADDGTVEIQFLRLQHLFSTERQQLLRQRRRSLPCLLNLDKIFTFGITWKPSTEQQFRIAKDGGEEVIEIVRDAAGELPQQPPFSGRGETAPQRFSVR